jgi:prevent-host-death family protein
MAKVMFNIQEAKTHLSRLLQRVAAGEEVIIARANQPIARLVPIEALPARRTAGRLLGQIRWSDDFEDPIEGWEDLASTDPVDLG